MTEIKKGRMTFFVPQEMHTAMKIAAIKKNLSLTALALRLFSKYLRENEGYNQEVESESKPPRTFKAAKKLTEKTNS